MKFNYVATTTVTKVVEEPKYEVGVSTEHNESGYTVELTVNNLTERDYNPVCIYMSFEDADKLREALNKALTELWQDRELKENYEG